MIGPKVIWFWWFQKKRGNNSFKKESSTNKGEKSVELIYAKEKWNISNEFLTECRKKQRKIILFASMQLKSNVELALFF